MNLPSDFPHQPPKGFTYETKPFKRNVVAIWLHHPDDFVYSTDRIFTIWGFYDTKKGCYYAPINATKCGNTVDISTTRPYTAMQLKLNPLMSAFQS